MVYLDLDRARSADSYQLRVQCDEDLYVDESNVWSAAMKEWVKPANRNGNFHSYLSWEAPSGKAFVGLGAAKLRQSNSLRRLWLVLRLREKPPGVLAPATSIAFSAAVAIWLVGAVGAHSNGGADLVAFILALPAVAAGALGFRTDAARHGMRSVTALASIVASLLLSLTAIVVFLAQHQSEHSLRSWPLLQHRYFYFLTDGLWIALVCAASFNFTIVFGTLVMRWVRYGALAHSGKAVHPQ
jgi:hypothetical protein